MNVAQRVTPVLLCVMCEFLCLLMAYKEKTIQRYGRRMNTPKTCIVLEPVSRLLNARIPRLQRCIDKQHVESMVNDQRKEYDAHNCFSMVQSITLGVLGNDRFLLDGQHRITAYAELQKLGYPVHESIVPVIIYQASSKEELSEYYNRINQNMPIHPFEQDDAWADIGKTFVLLFQDAYGKYMKSTKHCRCPHISCDELKTHLMARNLDNQLARTNKSVYDFWNAVVELNEYMKNKASLQMCPKMQKRLRDCEEKATKLGIDVCYLGAWRHFEWLDIAMYMLDHPNSTCSISAMTSAQSRKRIPAAIREQVWKKHNKNTCDEGECFVCSDPLRFAHMECGHIVAHALGGSTSVDNMMPICKTCNRDMGIMNLMHYKSLVDEMVSRKPMDID